MNSKLKTTVVIPTFNSGSYLIESVKSVLDQTVLPTEVIVLDDGSTDGSVDALERKVTSESLEIRRFEKNRGKAAVLNEIFNTHETDLYLIQDADDIALKDRIEKQVEFMCDNPRVVCSSGFLKYIGPEGKEIGQGILDLTTETRLEEYLAGDEPFGLFCPAVIIRASAVKDKNLQFRGEFWPADDIDLWNRLAEDENLVLAQPEFVVKYRIHGSSIVTSGFLNSRMQFEWVRASLRARRQGKAEPTKEEFLEEWNSVSWFRTINRGRKIWAKGLYRSGGFAISGGKLLSGGFLVLGAFFLQPRYVLNRLKAQKLKGR